jgi:hypothetical protein
MNGKLTPIGGAKGLSEGCRCVGEMGGRFWGLIMNNYRGWYSGKIKGLTCALLTRGFGKV